MLYDRPYMRQDPPDAAPQKASMVTTLLVITIAVFVLQQVLNVLFPGELNGENRFMADWFALNGQNFRELKVWTIFSFGLLHSTEGLYHILGNMLGLFFIGRIVEPIVGRERFLWLYISGTFAGGLIYLLLHFNDEAVAIINGELVYPVLVGASASVMAILAFFCLLHPERMITLLLFFVLPITVKPKWVFWGSLAISLGGVVFYELPGNSPVAHSAHLGGLFTGILYFKFFHNRSVGFSSASARPAVELPEWFKRKQKTEKNVSYTINRSKSRNELQKEVDRILDKINTSGFGSLTDDEKRTLDSAKDILSR